MTDQGRTTEVLAILDRLASLVERLANGTPEQGVAREVAIAAGRLCNQPKPSPTVKTDEVKQLRAALQDMWSGWRYIRRHHGDLSGVGWDRCEQNASEALGRKTPYG